jgi:hypothetical protein
MRIWEVSAKQTEYVYVTIAHDSSLCKNTGDTELRSSAHVCLPVLLSLPILQFRIRISLLAYSFSNSHLMELRFKGSFPLT